MTETKARKCGNKIRHRTRADADAHLERLVEGGASREWLKVYRCSHCKGGWHVGHRSGRRKP